MVPVEGVKQGVGRGEVIVWEISPNVCLEGGRGFWRHGGGIRVCLALVRDGSRLGRPYRRRERSGNHTCPSRWKGAVVVSCGCGRPLVVRQRGGSSGIRDSRLTLAGGERLLDPLPEGEKRAALAGVGRIDYACPVVGAVSQWQGCPCSCIC